MVSEQVVDFFWHPLIKRAQTGLKMGNREVGLRPQESGWYRREPELNLARASKSLHPFQRKSRHAELRVSQNQRQDAHAVLEC